MTAVVVVSQDDVIAGLRCLEGVAPSALCWIDDASEDGTAEQARALLHARLPHAIVRRTHTRRGRAHCLTLGARLLGGADVLMLHAGAEPAALPPGEGTYWLSLAGTRDAVANTAPLHVSRALFEALGGLPHSACPHWAFSVLARWYCEPVFVPPARIAAAPEPAAWEAAWRGLLTRVLLAPPLNPALRGPQQDPARFWDWAEAAGCAELARRLLFPYAAGSRMLDPAR